MILEVSARLGEMILLNAKRQQEFTELFTDALRTLVDQLPTHDDARKANRLVEAVKRLFSK
jgi:hypothetical protein